MSRVILLDRSGSVVRRCEAPRGTPFVLNLRDGHYYDAANPTTFVRRSDVKADYLCVGCPTCDAFPGWACGRSHVDPIHRARIVASLATEVSSGG